MKKNDDNDEEVGAPLNSTADVTVMESLVTRSNQIRLMSRQLTLAVLLSLSGWYFPRNLISKENDIEFKPAPYQTTASGDVILDFTLNQPLVDPPTISSSSLVWWAVQFPMILFVLSHARLLSRGARPNDKHHLRHLWLLQPRFGGFLTSIGLSEGITQLLKLLIQRRRPNFYALCGWNTEKLKCTASLSLLREANFSFPSGHSSLTCCSMTFLMWLALGCVLSGARTTDGTSTNVGRRIALVQFQTLLSIVLPLGFAVYVAASRLIDHWHHPADVLAGLTLGFSMGTVGYHLWFPPIWWWREPHVPWSVHVLSFQSLDASSHRMESFQFQE